MRRFLLASFVIAVFAAIPLGVTAQNKNNNDKSKTSQAGATDYAALTRYSTVVGKIVSTEATKITVSIENPHVVQNTANGKARRPGTTVQHDHIEFELPLKDKAVVKKTFVSSGFDDKGNPKSAGADAKKPATAPGGGTVCDITDLVPGTVVRLQLGSPKKSPSSLKKDDDASDLAYHSIVNSVTATSEPSQMAADNGKKGKKNQ
jgi:hypothetical protein